MFKIDGQPVSLFRGSLQEIPEWIKRTLTQRERTEDPDEFVSLMRDLVRSLTNYLPSTEKYPSFFEHIIASLPKDSGQVETSKQAAAYLLLNQIVFYSILSEGRGYPKIDIEKLRKPEDLKGYFDVVLKDDYKAIFGTDVASIFPRTATGFIRDLVKIINLLEPEQFTRDVLGNAFHQLIPQEVRKPVAAYYTNPSAARLLAKLAIKSSTDSVADFACGSGTLLMAAYERKAELIDHSFQEHDHKKFIERDITGIDIMPFAAHLAVIQLALNNPGYWTDEVRVAIYDSTNLIPGMCISSLQNMLPEGQSSLEDFYEGGAAFIEEGAVSQNGAGKGFSLGHVDVVIMNPPFTKKQFIQPDHREMLTRRFSDFKKYVNKEMSYWSYFILLADRFLNEGGRLALVLPASILRQVTYRNIRKLLCEKYTIHHVITTEFRSAFSESTLLERYYLLLKNENLKIMLELFLVY